MKKSPKQRLCRKGPYDKQRQTTSGLKTHSSSHRIPIVSRPSIVIQAQEGFANSEMLTSQPRTETYNLNPIADQDSKQKVSIVVENPFDCLASFYFPEDVDNNKSVESNVVVKSV